MTVQARLDRLTLLLVGVMISLGLYTLACGAKVPPALTSTAPTNAQIVQVQNDAKRFADGNSMAQSILQGVGSYIDSSPLADSVKNDIECAGLMATGTTNPPPAITTTTCAALGLKIPQGPGPLVVTLKTLQSLTTSASLKTTIQTALSALQPALTRLAASTNSTLHIAGISLTAIAAVWTTLLGGA